MKAVHYPALALKGVVERGEPGAYFSSTLALRQHTDKAMARGWVTGGATAWLATDAGRAVYESSGLAALPQQGRGYMWDWSGVKMPEET